MFVNLWSPKLWSPKMWFPSLVSEEAVVSQVVVSQAVVSQGRMIHTNLYQFIAIYTTLYYCYVILYDF